MSITGQQNINIGLPNESTGSDSLYAAFTKTQQNFTSLFTNASPYNTFTPENGIAITANSTTGIVTITNTGVTNLIAGTNIVLSGANGNVTISATGNGGGSGGTVTSVGVTTSSRLVATGSPIVSSGNINLDLGTSGVTAGSYTNPSFTVDQYGRVTAASNGAISGTVTSVGLTPGSGIQINGGPITGAGNITVTNTGVTQLTAGAGIQLSGTTGAVTISAPSAGGTVTSVGVSSSQLVITNSPIVSAGTIGVDLPASATFSGNVNTGGEVTIGTFMLLTPSTAPSSPSAGMVYYDSGSNTLKCYNGTAWKTITMA